MTNYYKFNAEFEQHGSDYNFEVLMQDQFVEGWAYEFDNNSDCPMKVSRKTGKQRITVMPFTEGYYYEEGAYEAVFDTELATKVFDRLKTVEAFWFARDLLSYASKHGKLI